MTTRQKILKAFYPLFMMYRKIIGENKILHNISGAKPAISFYNFSVLLTNGGQLFFENFRGKKILLVNTASNCGFTNQYSELQKLYDRSNKDLMIVAFPSNDFKQQEKENDNEIENFCTHNFGIGFPLTKKTFVRKSPQQHPVFQWLTHKEQNGWNSKQPGWNFSKYLVNEQGVLTHYFDPGISPLSAEIIKAVHQ